MNPETLQPRHNLGVIGAIRLKRLLAVLGLVLAGSLHAQAPDTAALTQTLAGVVKAGRVDYPALKRSPGGLDDYLARAAAVPRSDFDSWNANDRKAFLINVYNTATLRLVLDHYPVHSIKDIGPFYSTPWKIRWLPLFGGQWTLNEVESLLRGIGDPRVHFSIVCASKSCPYLAAMAYTPEKLDGMLDANIRAFLADRSRNRYSAQSKTLWLSPIFKWFGDDFRSAGGVRSFVARYATDPAMAKAALDPDVTLDWTHYDWSLNAQSGKS